RHRRLPGTAEEGPAKAGATAPSFLPADRAGEFNDALMELGATVCKPRSPSCERCPLAPHCKSRKRGDAHAFPPPKSSPARRVVVWAAGALTPAADWDLLRPHRAEARCAGP